MQLINLPMQNQSSKYIYKLEPGDRLMIYPSNDNIYVIIDGILIINKLFSNQEKFSTDLIYTGYIIYNLFQTHKISNYCYEVEPLSTSYIISIDYKKNNDIYQYSQVLYNTAHHGHALLSHINLLDLWVHKNIKHRIIHLVLALCEIAGQDYQTYIRIDIRLTYNTIATITGSNRNTVSTLMKQLETDRLLIHQIPYIIVNNIFKLNSYTIR
uniref:Global nitrogen transcriptional regulator n=1 Tax=Hommersandiophycus borowitzkae TaxID=268573 RepID=A0A1G4NU81_9FLOR|nr:Global nitrogen transcriptional regulator [Hommersandiophycus borowitzkae]SCW22253.1 Global nitrogen transcriptional regulator [Hommersandiophycus borowitzkae]